MRFPIGVAFATLLMSACAAQQALGQETELQPTYGTLNLRAGFPGDPATVNVAPGGELDASRLAPGCAGFIAQRPDIDVRYIAGEYPLTFAVDAETETTLVVRAPDGNFYCDGVGDGASDPILSFSDPSSGRYSIWVASASATPASTHAQLRVSEIESVLSTFWPVPEPTDAVAISNTHFASDRYLTDVDETLRRALTRAGYASRWRYYAVPGGFALVLEAEKIHADGAPATPRFNFRPPALLEIIHGLIDREPDVDYRQIVFLVTDRNWRANVGAGMTEDEARRLVRDGATELPNDGYADVEFAGRTVTALVYEFARGPAPRAMPRRAPPQISAVDHLKAARIALVR